MRALPHAAVAAAHHRLTNNAFPHMVPVSFTVIHVYTGFLTDF